MGRGGFSLPSNGSLEAPLPRISITVLAAFLVCTASGCREKFDIAGPKADLAVGEPVALHWRYVEPGNTLKAKGGLDFSGVIHAIEEESGGGVTGEQIVALISKEPIEGKITLIWARSVERGEDPASWKSGSKAAVKDSKFEYYNDYVSVDTDGNLLMFLDVEVKRP